MSCMNPNHRDDCWGKHPPPEVGERIRQLAGKRAAFRGHPADRLA